MGRKRKKKPTAQKTPWTPWGKWLKRRRERKERKKQARKRRRDERRRERLRQWTRFRRFIARSGAFVLLLLLACGIGFLVLSLLGRPYPWEAVSDVLNAQRLQAMLDEGYQRWDDLSISSYSVEVTYRSSVSGIQCGPGRIEVREGKVMSYDAAPEVPWFPAEVCDGLVDTFTIAGAFDWADTALNEFVPGGTQLAIQFDNSFGYPSQIVVDVYTPEMRAEGCCWQVEWRNFQLYNE